MRAEALGQKGDMKIFSILAESYHEMGETLRIYNMEVRSTIAGVYLRQLLSSLDPASQKYDTDKMRSRKPAQSTFIMKYDILDLFFIFFLITIDQWDTKSISHVTQSIRSEQNKLAAVLWRFPQLLTQK